MRDDPRPLKDLLPGATKALGIPSPEATGRVWARWKEIVGAGIASHSEPTSLRAGVLRIRADSPAWATEIGYLSGEILSRVNAVTGQSLVQEVRVWTGPPPAQANVPSAGAGAATEMPPREPPSDPAEAFERAHRAWAKRHS